MSVAKTPSEPRAIAGKYRLLRRLSQSPRAQVFVASVIDAPEEQYVLKLFNTSAMSLEQRQRMEKEIELAMTIEHPYVVAGIDSIDTEGIRGYAMEYATGGSLVERIENAPLSEREVLKIAAQLCSGLNALHSHGIVHRNIRPSTILFDKDGDVRISNFGIVREEGSNRLTEHQAVLGAAQYVSPEYLETGMLDRRSDIYAFGTVLYEMITGRLPFAYPNPVQALQARLTEEPRAPRAFGATCSESLQSIILRTLAKNPFSRYESGMEVLKDIFSIAPALNVIDSPCPDEAIYRSPLFAQDFSFDDQEEYEEEHYESLGSKILDWGIDAGHTTAQIATSAYAVVTSEEAKQGAEKSLAFTKRACGEGLSHSRVVAGYCAKMGRMVAAIELPAGLARAACVLLLGLTMSLLGYRYAGHADRLPQLAHIVSEIAEEFSEPIAAHANNDIDDSQKLKVEAQAVEEVPTEETSQVVTKQDVASTSTAPKAPAVLKVPAAPKVIRR